MGSDLQDGPGALQARLVYARCERCEEVTSGLAFAGNLCICHLCLSELMIQALMQRFGNG